MTITIEKPAPLDQNKFHTRAEVRAWHASVAAYYDAVRAEEARQREEQEKKENPPPRYLGDEDYDRIKRAEWDADMARRKQRADERAAKEQARADYLAGTPEVAEILASDPFTYTQLVAHWAAKGYTLPDDGIQHFTQGSYAARMNAPAAPASRKSK